MAGSFSDYLETNLLDQIVGKTDYTMPTAYVALYTATPSDAGGGTEVTDANNYSRVTTSGANWNAAATGSISNAQDLTFAQASGSWGTVTQFSLMDSGTHGAGNFLVWGDLTTGKAIGNGDTAKFAGGTPGDLVITLD
jgi:hypothetical protein